jgi:UDP-N-acetylglucosamine 2-epimerase (non-hydrolysing)
MKKKKKIYFFIGTVAEFNKLAPIFKELQKRKIRFEIIDSGQNQINYQDFKSYLGDIKPLVKINPKANKSSTLIFFFWAFITLIKGYIFLFSEFRNKSKSDVYFIIHGDTVTSTIGAILAKIHQLKLVHIEAGYFSHNFFEPFPEEICKHINSWLADILFAPTDWALSNLKRFNGVKISTKFNTNIEAFWWAMKQKVAFPLKLDKYYLLIVHRQEHVLLKKEWTKKIMEYVIQNSDPSLTCVILNHPLTVQIIKSLQINKRSIKIIDQLSYGQFLKVFEKSQYIATDSATIQQEAFYLGKPYLGLADYSVQTEGLKENAVLSRSDYSVIDYFLGNYRKYKRTIIRPKKSPSKIVVDFLQSH